MDNSLSNKIWLTRKTRIYTEKRLIFNEQVSNALMIWYSFSLVSFSIWGYQNNSNYDSLLIISSIGVLITSIYLSSQRFSQRAEQIKKCYISLDTLNAKALHYENQNNVNELELIHNAYSETLLEVENHIDFDYLSFRYKIRKNKDLIPPYTYSEHIDYILNLTWRRITVLILFAVPLISFLVINYYVSIS